MTSDSKAFEDAAANGKPWVCSTSYKDGRVTYVILMDDRYWRANEQEHDQIMHEGVHPEELELVGYTDSDLGDD